MTNKRQFICEIGYPGWDGCVLKLFKLSNCKWLVSVCAIVESTPVEKILLKVNKDLGSLKIQFIASDLWVEDAINILDFAEKNIIN